MDNHGNTDIKTWTNAELHTLFNIQSSRQTLLHAEREGKIPTAIRKSHGQTQVRNWTIDQLPAIGEKYGFISKPTKPTVITVFSPKGGVLKTTVTFNLARVLAIHNIKTLVIGLDIQKSLTELFFPQGTVETLELAQTELAGLKQYLVDGYSLDDVIASTDIPTLDIIPENSSLNFLEKWIYGQTAREMTFERDLIPQLKERGYEVIIFDNSPNWNQLIENSIVSANVILSPIGCDIGSFQALRTNIQTMSEFRDTIVDRSRVDNLRNFVLIPTLAESNKLSRQILASYIRDYSDMITTTTIRSSVKGQESSALYMSILEYDARSPVAEDYRELIKELRKKFDETENVKEFDSHPPGPEIRKQSAPLPSKVDSQHSEVTA